MSSFPAKLQAASTADSWHLALDKFPFHPASTDAPTLAPQADHRGPTTRNVRIDRLREARERYQASVDELDHALTARRAFLALLKKQHGPRLRRLTLVSTSRLLLQLDRPSALETSGLYLDRTTGLPLVPGCTIKGVVSLWACWESNEASLFAPAVEGKPRLEENRATFHSLARRILGDNDSNAPDCAGAVAFLGAWPKTVPALELDVVTPHVDAAGHGQEPMPCPFLAIESGCEWEFVLLADATVGTEDVPALLDTAERWLVESLEQIGLGAKTASGYGRFVTVARWAATGAGASPAKRMVETQTASSSSAATGTSDYANESSFSNRVIKKLNPGAVDQIQPEIEKLRKRENAAWRAQLIEALRGDEMRNVRKKLRERPWFPPDWLP